MIRTLQRLALAGALVALVAVPAHAQNANVTGKWEFTSEGGRGPQTTTFTFKQDGTTVTGSAVFAFGRRGGGGGDQAPAPIEIKDGKIDGNTLTFSMELPFGEGMTFTYKATVDGDTMKGTQTTSRGDREFTGKRVKE